MHLQRKEGNECTWGEGKKDLRDDEKTDRRDIKE